MHDVRTYHLLDESAASEGLPAEVVVDPKVQSRPRTAELYDRLAPFYDWLQAPLEVPRGLKRRARVMRGAVGDVLELGIGTGRNLGLYAPAVRLTAVDVSERMIERARLRAARLNRSVDVRLARMERLPFEPASFDTVTGTSVCCAVDDLAAGLQEVRRVLKPTGQLRLLERVRPRRAVLGRVVDYLSLVSRPLLGLALNRDVEGAVEAAGFEIVRVRAEGVWREIVARPARDA